MNQFFENLVNEEQIRFLALEMHAYMSPEQLKKSEEILNAIFVASVLTDFEKQGKTEFSEQEVAEAIEKMNINHSIDSLIFDGIIDQDFLDGQETLSLSERGKKIADKIIKDNFQ